MVGVLSWNMRKSEVEVDINLESDGFKDELGVFENSFRGGKCREGLPVLFFSGRHSCGPRAAPLGCEGVSLFVISYLLCSYMQPEGLWQRWWAFLM